MQGMVNAQLLRLAINAFQLASLIKHLSEVDDIARYLLKEVDDSLSGEEQDVMGGIALLFGYSGSFGVIETMLNSFAVRHTLHHLFEMLS